MARSSRNNSPAIKNLNRLRSQILQLAVQGKLVPQDATDEPASVLLKRIATEREQLVKTKKIKKPKPLPPIQPDEIPYDIPNGWEWARAGNAVLDVEYGHTAVASHDPLDGPRMLRITDIDSRNQINWDSVPWCPETDESRRKTLDARDIVVARTGGTVGKATLLESVPYRCIFASYLVCLRDAGFGLAPYLFTFMKSPAYWNQINTSSSGSAQPNVNGTKLSNLKIPLPPLTEQQRIVTKVDQLMTAIDELEAHLYRLETLRPKLLQLAVQGKLVPQDPADEPASVLLKHVATKREQLVKTKKLRKPKPLPPIQPDEIPYDIPKGWEWARLGELSLVVGGGTPKTSTSGMFTIGGLGHGWLTPADLSGNSKRYITHGARDLTDAGLASCSAVLLPTGSVAISSRAPIGYVAITSQPLSTNQGFRSLVLPITGLAEYLHIVVQAFQPRLEALGSGTTFKEISGAKLATLETPIPPLAEQQRIVTKVDQLIAAIDAITDPLTLLSEPHMSS